MDYHSYCAILERRFLKNEYISISQNSYRMFTSPTDSSLGDCKLFLFAVNGQEPSEELCQRFADYARSVVFYKNSSKIGKIYTIVLFFTNNDCSLFLQSRIAKTSGAITLPCIATADGLNICNKFPIIFSGDFKKLYDYAKKILK